MDIKKSTDYPKKSGTPDVPETPEIPETPETPAGPIEPTPDPGSPEKITPNETPTKANPGA